jgi:hypothetical protein
MKKGGTPSGQRAATQKRLRDIVEEKNPNAKTQKEEDGKEARRNFFSRETPRQSLPNIDIEMSGEPSAAPVFTTRTTPVQEPLLAFDPPPKKPDQRVDGQVYIHEDGLLKGVRVKWSASSKTYFCTCDTSVHHGNCKTKLIWPTEFGTCLLLRRVAESLSCRKKLLSTWKAFRSELITVYEQPSATHKKASSTWS